MLVIFLDFVYLKHYLFILNFTIMQFNRGDRVMINKDASRYQECVGEIVLIYTFTPGNRVFGVYFKVLGSPIRLNTNTFYFREHEITLLKKPLFYYSI